MKKIFLMLLGIGIPVMSLLAQNVSTKDSGSDNKKLNYYEAKAGTYESRHQPYISNSFKDNWFIGVDFGTQSFVGGAFDNSQFRRGSWGLWTVSIGKYVTPALGFRLQFGYGELDMFGNNCDGYVRNGESSLNGQYLKSNCYTSYHVDLLWNITTSVMGYDSKRVYELVGILGTGLDRSTMRDQQVGINFGLQNKIRLSKVVDFNFGLKLFLTDTHIKKVLPDVKGSVEGLFGFNAGLAIKINNKPFSKYNR